MYRQRRRKSLGLTVQVPEKKSPSRWGRWGLAISAGSVVAVAAVALPWPSKLAPTLRVNFSQAQLDLLQQAYDSLKESVYASLVLQTRA